MCARRCSKPKSSPLVEARAHYMRHNPTWSELVLWQELHAKKLGAAFRRQVPIGNHIVDFLAPARRLVIEVDGGYHAERAAADARRDRVLVRYGYRVLRLDEQLVLRNMPEALARIRAALARPP